MDILRKEFTFVARKNFVNHPTYVVFRAINHKNDVILLKSAEKGSTSVNLALLAGPVYRTKQNKLLSKRGRRGGGGVVVGSCKNDSSFLCSPYANYE